MSFLRRASLAAELVISSMIAAWPIPLMLGRVASQASRLPASDGTIRRWWSWTTALMQRLRSNVVLFTAWRQKHVAEIS